MAGRGASRLRRARGPRGHARCAAEGGCRLASRDSSADAITRAKSGSTRNPACRSVSAFRTLPRLMPSRPGRFGIAAPLVLACGVLAGCAPAGPPHPVSFQWLVGRPEPAFDPQGPPDPVLWSLLRLLNHGLVEEDSALAIVPAAAEEVAISEDGLTYTFHLRPALQYMDGTRCASGDFRACLEAGLRRSDCGIQAWALAAVRGVDRVRPDSTSCRRSGSTPPTTARSCCTSPAAIP